MHDSIDKQQILAELQCLVDSEEFRSLKHLRQLLMYAVFSTLARRDGEAQPTEIAVPGYARMQTEQDQIQLIRTLDRAREQLNRYYLRAGRENLLRLDLVYDAGEVCAVVSPRDPFATHAADFTVVAIEPFTCSGDAGEHAGFCAQTLQQACLTLSATRHLILYPPASGNTSGADPATTEQPTGRPGEANLLLSGSLRWEQTHLHAFAQLVDAQTLCPVWADSLATDWDPDRTQHAAHAVAAFISDGVRGATTLAAANAAGACH